MKKVTREALIPPEQYEYKVLPLRDCGGEEIHEWHESLLNTMARQGWRVVCCTGNFRPALIMERPRRASEDGA